MCGIAGILASNTTDEQRRDLLGDLLDAISHRGPDDAGSVFHDGLALGMRRLSIIDIQGGRQPMISPDGRYSLVFNGEIYNFPDLKRELIAKGHLFRTRCDTEVILHGYREWGEAVVHRLNGMFAFAMYDRRAGELFLARDHFGVKPLYYFARQAFFAFCSEPIPLLSMPGVSRRLNLDALKQFLAYKYVPAPATFVDEIKKLEPASCLRVDGDGRIVRHRTYWRLAAQPADMDFEEATKKRLIKAVERQLISDVPVGVFLSGGIDSGLLLWAAGQSGHSPLPEAYTVGFDDESFDETALASQTAARLNAQHHVERLPFPDAEQLDGMVEDFGEPFANISIPANFAVSRAAAHHVKVVLNGTGADELFGGYDRYYAVRPPRSLAMAKAVSPLLGPLARALPTGTGKRSLVTRARRFLETAGATPAESHACAIRLFTRAELGELVPGLEDGEDPIIGQFRDAPDTDDLDRAIWVDVRTMLADDYLTLVDRTSMGASLEVRVPFLDLDLATHAFSLPPFLKISGWNKKRILRQLAEQYLPLEVARGPKQGFESPVGSWFRGPLADTFMEHMRQSPVRDIMNLEFTNRLLRAHGVGRRDSSKQLLGLYTLCVWTEAHSITI